MKKILSVMLAIMMLFGALSISASAAELTHDDYVSKLAPDKSNVVIVFVFNGGTSKYALPVYTPDSTTGQKFTQTEGVTGTYYMLPGAGNKTLANGCIITMPSVIPPEGLSFRGWKSTAVDHTIAAADPFIIDKTVIAKAHADRDGVIYMEASYETAVPEEDTLATVLGVLTKVFGTIIGILFMDGQSAAGIALVEKLLGGLL